MAIAFNCPHCNTAYKLKDELAGKRATCKNPACRQVIVIPAPATVPPTVPPPLTIAELGGLAPEANGKGKDHTPPPVPPADVEAAALSALADAPKEEAPENQVVPVECPFCSHKWTEPAAKSGKNTLCPNPECRQRVKVPVVKAKEDENWREKAAGPSLAKQNVEKPQDVMDAEARYVSGEAWKKGGGAEQELDPIPLSRKLFWAFLILAPIVALVGSVVYYFQSRSAGKQDRLMTDAVEQLKTDELPPAQGALYSAIIELAAGEYALRQEKDRDKELTNALNHFTKAREGLHQAERKDDARHPTDAERYVIAGELALATLGLGGSDEEVAQETRYRWVPQAGAGPALRMNQKVVTVHQELRRTLDLLRPAEFDLKAGVARRLTRELVKKGQVGLVSDIPVMLFTEPEQAEARAVVALEVFRLDKASPVARQIADELRGQLEKGAAGKNPAPVSAQILWRVLGVPKAPTLVGAPQTTGQVPDATRLAYVGQWVLEDKAAEALALARRAGPLPGQLRALLVYAEWAADPAPAFDAAIAQIAAQTKGKKDVTPPLFVVFRLSQLAAAAGKTDQAMQLADLIPDEGLKVWAKGDVVRLAATPENKSPMDEKVAEAPDDPRNLRAGHAWGRLWVARHNTRLSGDRTKEATAVERWQAGTIKPFGLAGVALGLKDR